MTHSDILLYLLFFVDKKTRMERTNKEKVIRSNFNTSKSGRSDCKTRVQLTHKVFPKKASQIKYLTEIGKLQ